MDQQPTDEILFKSLNGWLVFFLLPTLIGLLVIGIMLTVESETIRIVAVVAIGVVGLIMLCGFFIVNPNDSRALVLFGRYRGTVRSNGFYWTNPFTIKKPVSLRVRNLNTDTLKVNDLNGNPIEIATIVVWRVKNTGHALFDVDDYEGYIDLQCESAVRQLASRYPYDISDEEGLSLRGSRDEVAAELVKELGERLDLAGIEILEARLSHLAYAPEIASAMLRRQQADAVIAARQKIVDGAVGMVEMALDKLKAIEAIELDNERRASMVSNLMVVLCSETGVQPVVNTGTLYN